MTEKDRDETGARDLRPGPVTSRPTSTRGRKRRSTRLPTLTRFGAEDLDRLLGLLDEALKERGVAASVYIVGGAAIAFTVDASRRTVDVDVFTRDRVALEVARTIAEREGGEVHVDWLNTSATPWVPPRPVEATVPPTRPGLTRHIAPAEHLLAMKLVASRVQDENDIVALVSDLGLVAGSAEDFADLLERVYDGEGALAQVLGVRDEDVRYEALWCGRQAVDLIRAETVGPRRVAEEGTQSSP
jgi:predicted nucleotidyltransferase